MLTRLPFPNFPLAIGHKPARKIYYVTWGGIEGVRKSKARGKNAVDIDVAISRDGIVVPVHGPTLYSRTRYWGGFKRVPGVGGLAGRVDRIDAADLYRLEHKTGAKINTLREVLTECVRLDMVACLEAKGGGWSEAAWQQVYDLAEETGAWVVAMALHSRKPAGNRAALARLRPAAAVGLPTMLLVRGVVGPEWSFLSAVKSGTRQTVGHLPASIRRIKHLVTAPPAPRRSPVVVPPKPEPKPEEAPVANDDRYDLTTYDGRKVNRMTAQALDAAAKELGYPLSLTQGSYNGEAVKASAGTHAGGGVVDLKPWDWEHKIPALRRAGFWAWYRREGEGPWPDHIHAVLAGDESAAPSAKAQVLAGEAGRNGLANNAADPHRGIEVRRFKYRGIPRKGKGMNQVEYGRTLVEAGVREMSKARIKGKPRRFVQVMAAAVLAALKAGPKS